MTARCLMFQGTGSDVGKSLLVAGLCRLFARQGLKVVPFKAQNMSNNAAVADDARTLNGKGKGEIGRAQWLQALAAGVAPSVHMNPVLLKPQSDKTSQIIVRGKLHTTMGAKEYQEYRKELLPQVLESYRFLAENADIMLVEGAGSPAEINLRENDIANMGFARVANCPVVMIGDIERGGVIASLVGTHAVLSDDDRGMIRGFIVNKFRGDSALFESGQDEIVRRTGWENLGLVPYFSDLAKLPQEDSLALFNSLRSCATQAGHLNGASRFASSNYMINVDILNVAVLRTPHIANFDDFDPLANDPNIRLLWVSAGQIIPADADIVVLAGSKSTIADLAFIKAQGWDIDLQAHRRRGGRIIGICGGFQMLGKTLSDPHGVEGEAITVEGLGLLDVDTVITAEKIVRNVKDDILGYEIHAGETIGVEKSSDGLVWGTYIHGLFADDKFRADLLQINSSYNYKQNIDDVLNDWADILDDNINIKQLLELAG